jgi:nitrogen regulatory protein P-II 2
MVEQVIESVISSAHTGRVGDGKVFVTDLPQVVRIRNRETGDAAL